MRLKVPSLEVCTGQGDTISLWQAVQEEQFCLQVRAGTSTGQPQPGHSFIMGGGDNNQELLLQGTAALCTDLLT